MKYRCLKSFSGIKGSFAEGLEYEHKDLEEYVYVGLMEKVEPAKPKLSAATLKKAAKATTDEESEGKAEPKKKKRVYRRKKAE